MIFIVEPEKNSNCLIVRNVEFRVDQNSLENRKKTTYTLRMDSLDFRVRSRRLRRQNGTGADFDENRFRNVSTENTKTTR